MSRCPSCDVEFSTRSNMLRHLRSVKICRDSNECIQCSYCEYAAVDIEDAKIHEKRCKMKKVVISHQAEIDKLNDLLSTTTKEMVISHQAEINKINDLLSTTIKDMVISHQTGMNKINDVLSTANKEIEMLKNKNKTLKHQIDELKLELAEKKGMLATKTAPKTITNNNYTNPKLLTINCSTIDPFTVDTVKKAIQAGSYTFQHFKRGADGIADFISDMICTDDGQMNYACSDVSRNKCHRLIETREWETDNGASFIKKVLDQLKEPAIVHNQKIIDMWKDVDTRDHGDELRERTRNTLKGILHADTEERKELFTKVRLEVKKLAAI